MTRWKQNYRKVCRFIVKKKNPQCCSDDCPSSDRQALGHPSPLIVQFGRIASSSKTSVQLNLPQVVSKWEAPEPKFQVS